MSTRSRWSWRDERLEVLAASRRLHGRVEFRQRELGADQARYVDGAVGDRRDRLRIAVGTEVAAMDVQLFLIADEVPVDCRWLVEDAERNERAKAPDHVETLLRRLRASAHLDVDVASVAVGERLHPRRSILLQRVDRDVGAEPQRQLEPGRVGVERDDLARVEALRRLERT